MKRKRILVTLTAGAMAFGLSGCNTGSPMKPADNTSAGAGSSTEAESPAGNTATGSDNTIQFWNSFTGTDGDVLRDIVSQYNKENKNGYKIEMDIMPANSMEEKLPAAIATGTAPALVIKGNFDSATYGENGTFIPLDDFFDKTGTDKNDFSETSLSALQYDGKQIMIPMQVHTTYLFWNKDLFKAAGLDPDTPPATWKKVEEYAGKLTDSSKKVYGVGFPVSGAPCYFDAMFKSNKGDVVSADGTSSVLDSEANLKTLQYIQDLAQGGCAPVGATGADTDNLMLAGQLGIYMSGPWLINGLKENDIHYGVAAMPAGSDGAKGVVEVQGFGVTSSATEQQKKIAYDFIAYWNSKDVCKQWSLKNGYPPYLKSVTEDPEIQGDDTVKALSGINDFGFAFAPGVKAASQINSDVLFPLVESVIAGNDVQSELTSASREVDKLLKK